MSTAHNAHTYDDRIEAAFREMRQGHFDVADGLVRGLLAEALGRGDLDLELRCHAALGQSAGRRMDWVEAIDRLERAAEMAVEHGLDPRASWVDLGMVLMRIGEPEAAAEVYERAIPSYAAIGSTRDVASCSNNLGHALVDLGRFEEAVSSFERVVQLDVGETRKDAHVGALTGLVVALSYLRRLDDASAALTQLERWLDTHETSAFRTAHATWARGHLRMLQGDPRALDDARACVEVARTHGQVSDEVGALRLSARAAAAIGDHAAAYGFEREASEREIDLHRTRRDEALAVQAARHRAEAERQRSEQLASANAELQRANALLKDQAVELERARDAAHAAAELRKWFLAVVSHELRTPLNGVVGAASLLAESSLDAEQRDLMAVVRSSSELMLAMVGDLLDAARLEAGNLELRPGPVDLVPLLTDTLGMLAPAAREKGVALSLAVSSGTPTQLVVDAQRLRQIVVNLAANAVKFTPEGRVEVTCDVEDGHLVVHVDDAGPGVPMEDRARIFQPFQQVESGTTRAHQGTGLGLSIAQQLARLFEGHLSVGDSPAGGARFTFRAPLSALQATAPAESATRIPIRLGATVASRAPSILPDPDAHEHRDILVVDDDAVCRHVQAAMLRRLGATVRTADGGEAALREVSVRSPDLVFVDWMMPGMDGPAVARALRARGYQGPILALTANAEEGLAQLGESAGIGAVYAKPARVQDLRAALERWGR